MSMSKNIARLAVTAGLTAALSFGGVMAPVTMAFAAGSGSTVTFNDPDYGASTTYKGIQIFRATVTTTAEGTTVSNIAWVNDGVKAAVLSAIREKDSTFTSDHAQDAADWLNANAEVAGTDSKVASDNVLSLIAANLDGVSGWETTTAGSPSLSGLDAGYWLFLTATVGTPDGKSTDAFTSPVYAVIDGTSTTTVKPKKSIPTVNKQILAATSADPTQLTNGWAGVANSQIGQEVTYKLTGKVADNYATYDSYAYKFTDTLSNGLDYVDGSLKVYAVNNGVYTPINSGYDPTTPTEDNRVLTVNFAVDKATGKKGLKDIDFVNADTEIVVFYKAKLNKNAVTGNGTEGKKGNYNAVKLEYSNNPYTEGTGTSVEGGAGDFTFKLNLNKVDQGTEKGLAGAVFTIKSNNKYVASKDGNGFVAGELVDAADNSDLPEYVKFTSTDEGKIAVKGLDAGTYTVTEIKAPNDKYTVANPFTFTIEAKYKDNAAELEKITVSPSQNDERRSDVALGTLNNTPGDNTLTATDNTAANVQTGEVNITIGNTKQVGLPLTGLNGVTFTWIAGGAVLCIGVAHLIRSRKQAEESEQE